MDSSLSWWSILQPNYATIAVKPQKGSLDHDLLVHMFLFKRTIIRLSLRRSIDVAYYQTLVRVHPTAPLLVTVVLASQDLHATEKAVRSAVLSPRRKSSDRTTAKGTEKPKGETRDILDLAGEFNKMVTRIAFEKFDFHQWFRYARQRDCQ